MHAAAPDLELVAVENNQVFGHVLAAPGDLAGQQALAVAPLSVHPNYQRQGIGSALMTELLDRADRRAG